MSLHSEHFNIFRVSHIFLWVDLHFCLPLSEVLQPLIKAVNGPNGAISLKKQTFNRILFYFCNRQYFGIQKEKTGIGEQSYIVQPKGRINIGSYAPNWPETIQENAKRLQEKQIDRRYKRVMNTGFLASKYNFGINNLRLTISAVLGVEGHVPRFGGLSFV